MSMTPFEATIYGVVQGLTEFIPVSSNAHLEVTSVAMTGRDIGAAFTAVIQWGTWVACVIYFWKDVVRLTRAFLHGIWLNRPFATQDAKLAWMLLIGTVPIGIVGILLKHWIEHELRWLYVLAAAAIGFALVLAVAEGVHVLRVRSRKPLKDLEAIGWGETLVVGFAQCFALTPGASRSGTTITGGIFCGLTRETAARFSFLLSLPSVFAAGLYELYKERQHLLYTQQDALNLVIATVVAGVVGYASIAFLIRFLKYHSTWVFIGYRVAAGALLAFLIWRGVLPNQLPEEPGDSAAAVLIPRSQALPGNALPGRLCLPTAQAAWQSLAGSAFPGRAWERESGTPSREENGNFARTFSPPGRLSFVGGHTVSASADFLKSAVTKDEESGIFSIEEENRPSRQVRLKKGRQPKPPTNQRPTAGRTRPAQPFPLDHRRSVMALFTLRSLALRGVAVVRDGLNVDLRLGVEMQPASPTPEVRINPRHPSNQVRSVTPAQRPDDHAEYDRMAARAVTGAGRSLRCDGVSIRRGAAIIAGPAIPLGWCKSQGTPQGSTKRLSKTDKRGTVETAGRLAGLSPAGWMPSASTWAS
ncbi:MAG TPA: undecaprenyl-diphosphatase UppP [Gemmataceae bacterium]|nr:undecaprenyl-diphosphatase UppP [Gemmataceae bacterium]